jgi:beta propeller repeat protein
MYDIISKEETQVTNTQMGVSAEIYGDKIVYWDTKSGNADIYMYNITSGTESQITTNSSGQTEPAIYDNKIVWSDNRNGTDNWDIYMYDITTGTESPVISHPFSQSNSAIYGNKIVWQDWRNGYLDIYMVDTVSSSETRVTTDSNLNTAPTDITLS